MSRELEVQCDVARIALAGVGGNGFALAGSGAIREHGIIDRPTQGVDLFTTMAHLEQVERVCRARRRRYSESSVAFSPDPRSVA